MTFAKRSTCSFIRGTGFGPPQAEVSPQGEFSKCRRKRRPGLRMRRSHGNAVFVLRRRFLDYQPSTSHYRLLTNAQASADTIYFHGRLASSQCMSGKLLHFQIGAFAIKPRPGQTHQLLAAATFVYTFVALSSPLCRSGRSRGMPAERRDPEQTSRFSNNLLSQTRRH